MTMAAIQRVLPMDPDVVDYLEASAMRLYERWDADAKPRERATLAAFDDQP